MKQVSTSVELNQVFTFFFFFFFQNLQLCAWLLQLSSNKCSRNDFTIRDGCNPHIGDAHLAQMSPLLEYVTSIFRFRFLYWGVMQIQIGLRSISLHNCLTVPRMRAGKTKFATVKWYNLCLQIIQTQMCYPLVWNKSQVRKYMEGSRVLSNVLYERNWLCIIYFSII